MVARVLAYWSNQTSKNQSNKKDQKAVQSETMLIEGVQVPRFLYGTAWKESRTKRLIMLALDQGFRGIDTANQRKHYNEVAVGEGIKEMIRHGFIDRNRSFFSYYGMGRHSP